MATKQLKELKNLSASELSDKMREVQGQLFQTRMKQVTGQLTDTASLWKLRKQVARINTLLSQSPQAEMKQDKQAKPAAKA